MKRTSRTAIVALILGAIGALALTGGAVAQDTSGTPTADQKVTLNVGVDSDVTSLNPYNLCCGPDYEYLSLVYDIAFDFDNETLAAAPRLVKTWTPNEDS